MTCSNTTEKACGVFAGIGVVAIFAGMAALFASAHVAKKFDTLFKANATLPDVNPDYLKNLKFKSDLCSCIMIGSVGPILFGAVGFSLGLVGAGFRK